jgi:hypothetical protein
MRTFDVRVILGLLTAEIELRSVMRENDVAAKSLCAIFISNMHKNSTIMIFIILFLIYCAEVERKFRRQVAVSQSV